MKSLNKFSAALSIAALGLMGLTSCENADIYEINSPDWLAQRVDSIANSKGSAEEVVLEGQMEDVYTVGKTDYTSGWWASFTKTYVVPDGKKWQAQFNLNINPSDNTYYKNFALIVATDDRGGANYSEYGAFRYDLTGDANAYNSNWGTVFGVITSTNEYQYTSSNVLFAPEDNKDAGLQKMAGKVTLTIDRTDANRYYMEINNGTICKTYDMPSNIAPGEDIYCFLCPEGSYIDFLSTNIEPIGGCTSREDKQPLEMALSGVPSEVLVGTPLDSAMVSVTANISFEQMLSKTVTIEDLQIEVIPDMDKVGEKTLVAMYNKTWKGVSSEKIIVASKKFKVVNELSAFTKTVVVPAEASLGLEDNTTPWWSVFTESFKVAPKETKAVSFTNYAGGSNWNNYVVILTKEDTSKEYAVVRADNFGWGDGYAACTHECAQTNDEEWATWLAAMDGARVTVYVTNNGDGTADVKGVAKSIAGDTYVQTYKGINGIDPDDFCFRFTVDNSHIVFDKELGTPDCGTGWWSVFTQNVKVDSHQICTVNFTNYTSGAGNWNNFVVILNREDLSEYAVVRADNYGWGDGYAACTHSGTQGDWATWLAAMYGAKVSLTINNKGDGTVDIHAEMLGNDGNTYTQDYIGINTIDPDDLYFRFTCDSSYLVFE